ncbi:MAG: MazG family protein [Clostridiales bacterium]|jgi:tetrapyrrole methylase family protein/MazG family protein|nr:MazG family protein [Clostridiales bacterium]
MNLKIIGAGYRDGDMTQAAVKAVVASDCVILKSKKLDCAGFVKKSGADFVALDGLYESAANFDELNASVVDFVTKKAETAKNAVFVVGGAGYDDLTAAELIRRGADIIPGVSASAYAAAELVKSGAARRQKGGDSGAAFFGGFGVCAVSAQELIGTECFFPDKRFCLAVGDIDDKYTASDLKLRLSDIYGDVRVLILHSGGRTLETTLFELDGQKKAFYDYRTTLIIPPSDMLDNIVHDMSDLYAIMKRLRGKDGCKWDIAQTHKSLRINVIEEAYELADAIDKDDIDMMLEESGDVLLQAVFHAVIAEDDNEFSLRDVINALCVKLITRHTHIFGDDKAADEREALSVWDKAKTREKKYKDLTDKMNSVPESFPALLRAEKVLKTAFKAAKAGEKNADSPLEDYAARISQKIRTIDTADAEGRGVIGGEILLDTAECLAARGVEPETALRDAVNAFINRFAARERGQKGDETP